MGAIQQIIAAQGGSTAFSPSDIAGLTVWFKADAIAGKVDGDALTTWADSSGNSRTATAGAISMTYKTGGPNSKPFVRFTDPGLTGRAYASTPSITAIAAWTVFVVFKSFDTGVGRYIIDAADGSHSIIQDFTAGKIEYFSSPRTVLGNVSTSLFQIITCSVGSTSTGAWTLGGDASHGVGNLGRPDIAEIVAYNTALSGGNTTSVQSYLATKYAL